MELKLSESERYIMECFWARGALKSDELAGMVQSRAWKPTTLLTFLSRLVAKDMLTITRNGKQNLYAPMVSREQYLQAETASFVQEMYKGSTLEMLAAMVDGRKITAAELAELRSWLNEMEVQDAT